MGADQTKLLGESVAQLKTAHISPANLDFWARFWSVPIPLKDSFAVIKSEDLRKIRRENPRNYATLIVHLLAKIKRSLIQKNTAQDLQQVLSCVRLLTRLIPLAFEGSHSDAFELTLFWKNIIPTPETQAAAAQEQTESSAPVAPNDKSERKDPVIEPVVPLKLDTPSSAPPTAHGEPAVHDQQSLFEAILKGKPLGRQLIDALFSLLFFSDFTCVAFKETVEERSKIEELPLKYCWAPGVGTSTVEYYNQTAAFDSNRAEVLLCLLTLMSRSIYFSPSQWEHLNFRHKWLDEIISHKRKYSRAFFCSLLNVIFRYDPVGWGVPYNYIMSTDAPEQLMNVSAQVLNVLLEYKPVSPLYDVHSVIPSNVANTNAGTAVPANIFVEFVQGLTQTGDFDVIFNGLVKLLTNPVNATNTYLPGATKQITIQQELVCLLWQFVQSNKAFSTHVLRKDEFAEILYPILHFAHEGRKDNAQLGFVHLATFLILYLSGERDFSIALNRPFTKKIFIDINRFTGNFGDYLVLVLIKLFADGHPKLESLWECMLTIMANISPYLKSLSLPSALRLLKLFVKFSSRKFLFESERNYRFVFFLLEMFNNFIQYQYEGNIFLVYAIISHRAYFYKMLDLAKPDALTAAETSTTSATAVAPSTLPTPPQAAPSEPGKVEHAAANINIQSTDGEQVKFEPTQQWLSSWVPRLPIGTIIRFLNGILPQIETILDGTGADQERIITFLRKTTLVGILPVPHPILIRHYSSSRQTSAWFHQYLWGVIFLKLCSDPPVLRPTKPLLFHVRVNQHPTGAQQPPQKPPTAASQSTPAVQTPPK